MITANAGLTLILANLLAVETYGLVIAAIGAQLLVSRGLLLGVAAGMVRLATLKELGARAVEMGRAGLVVIAATTAACSVGAVLLAYVGPWPEVPPAAVAVILGGALGTALVDYGYHHRLARIEFHRAAVVHGSAAMARAILTVLAAALLSGEAMATFAAYCGVTLIAGGIQVATVMRNTSARPTLAAVRRLVRYSAWLGVADVLVVLSLYEGAFLLLRAHEPAQASVFGLALTLSLAFFALYNAFYEYIFARIVHVTSVEALRRFTIRSCAAAMALLLLCAPIVVGVALVTPHLVRAEFAGAVPVFYLLAASMLVLLLQAPLEAACHALVRPHLVLLGWGVRVTVMALLVLRSDADGAVGAALAQLGSGVIAAGALSLLVVPKLRGPRLPNRERLECAG